MKLKDCFSDGLLRKAALPPEVYAKEIENAERHIDNALFCIEGEKYDLAVVSVYTSMFHTARSILFKDGLKERSHVCIIIYLKEKYPKLDEHTRILDSFRRSRHLMLYGIDVEALEDDARQGVAEAKRFLEVVRSIVK